MVKFLERDLKTRLHQSPDTNRIVDMINRDPFHLLNGITAEAFERDLDEPGERIREHTYVVEAQQSPVGYFSLCFVERNTHLAVYCYGTVDVDWRRHGIGTFIFKFIFGLLDTIARQEGRTIHFIHRAITSIQGECTLGVNFEMQVNHTLEILVLESMDNLRTRSLPSNIRFRSPLPDDAAAWADVYNDAFGGNKSAESVAHEFSGPGFTPNLYLFCTGEGGTPMGMVCSMLRNRHGRIPTIAVKKNWQRQGIGEAMLSEILQRLKQAGATDIQLSVDSRNEAAKSLYGKYGFRQKYKRIHYVKIFSP